MTFKKCLVFYLGSGDFTDNLSSVSGHDCVEGSGDSFDKAESTVFGQCQEQVLAQLVHLQLVTSGNKTLSLQRLLDWRICEEVGKSAIFLQGFGKCFEILFHSIQSLLFGGCGIKSCGISAFSSEDLNGCLNQLQSTSWCGQCAGENSQVTEM